MQPGLMSRWALAAGEGFLLLGVLDCGDTLSPTLPAGGGRERTSRVDAAYPFG
ncbi:hypothetical protein ABIA03_002817 [Bradyrhizobium yuanmingense]|uniref:Uncharacterized protein n=1 Tax=Bradyrhizobium yuanmingense TaxID=108015 RepID=A0ABV4GHA7_9BRAD